MSRLVRRSSQVVLDLLVLCVALAAAFALRFDWDIPVDMLRRLFATLPYIVVIEYACLVALAVHRFSWRFFGLRDAVRLGAALGISTLILIGGRLAAGELQEVYFGARYGVIPFGVIAINVVLAFVGLSGLRVLRRLYGERHEAQRGEDDQTSVPTLLVGAGQAGVLVAREVQQHSKLGISPVGFVDDDAAKTGTLVHGLEVLGKTSQIPELCAKKGAKQILITIASASGDAVRRISATAQEAGIAVKIIPGLSDIVSGKLQLQRIRDVAIEDLLRRPPVELDVGAITEKVGGRVVVVTGAGGSIGSELCRQICRYRPKLLVLVERAESKMFHIHRELSRTFPEVTIRPVIVDVCDPQRMRAVFERFGPELVLHAAAYKHVPLMEWNPEQAICNNVGGSRTVASLAGEFRVEAFVMISTDKAVRPSSIMGASKRAAELYVQSLQESFPDTRFVNVRFGNVLGSEGSVLPIFREQIAKGGPVTVTHPDMKRYFMTIPEACQLVLQAGAMGAGGEVFILDMGEPVKIVDLARDLIRLSGFEPETEIKIEFIGVRPGEKLYEELSSAVELDTTTHPSIFVEKKRTLNWEVVHEQIRGLESAAEDGEDELIRARLHELIPDFRTGVARGAKTGS